MSYESILEMNTAFAEHALINMDAETGAVCPPNLVPG